MCQNLQEVLMKSGNETEPREVVAEFSTIVD